MKNSQNEKLSEHLLNVDENTVSNAYAIDDAKKLKQYIKTKNAKIHRPILRIAAATAACLALVSGIVFSVPAMLGSSDSQPPIDDSIYNNNNDPFDNSFEEAVPPWEREENTNISINSIDMLNYYTAIKLLSDTSDHTPTALAENTRSIQGAYGFTMLSADSASTAAEDTLPDGEHTQSPIPEKILYYELDRNEVIYVSKVIFFQIRIIDDNGYLASKVGTGIVDVVITENSLEPMITFKNGDRYYSCCENTLLDNGKLYSTHKFIEGFYIVKNLEQENYSLSVVYDNFNLDYIDVTAKSVTCASYKNGGSSPDGELTVISKTYFSNESAELTVAELEEYFNSDRTPEITTPPTASNNNENIHVTEYAPRPDDTSLDFWITDNVGNIDFSEYTEVDGWFGGREFLGRSYSYAKDENGYDIAPKHYVTYLITPYPDYADGGQYVTEIKITDPAVSVYGLTVNSSIAEYEAVLGKMGYSITIRKIGENRLFTAEMNGEISFVFYDGDEPTLKISATVTNREGILY